MAYTGYQIPDLPWPALLPGLMRAEDTIARLDERLLKSEISEGWNARTHFMAALSSAWLEGETIHMEDLVLHDGMMDIRAPSHELIRAHAVLRARRDIARSRIDWTSETGTLRELLGRRSASGEGRPPVDPASDDADEADELS